MKKNLMFSLILSAAIISPAFSVDTYTGSLLESMQKKIDSTAAPVVNKEKQIRDQQAATQALSQKQACERQRQIQEQQRMQQELVNKKKQQVQTQKDLLNQQKQELKGLFSIQ